MAILMLLGLATLVWGWFALSSTPTTPSDDPYVSCPQKDLFQQIRGLWLPWLVMVVLAGVGLMVRAKLDNANREDRRVKTLAMLGVVAAVATCPLIAAALAGVNCGL